jgi:peptidoglycan/LPS O-acetylase OafA/YrhL
VNQSVSLYLDFLRFIAAFVVMFSHFTHERFTGPLFFTYSGHEAVIVFFVLSGYVINYVTKTKEKKINEYLISRFARLYSVVLPVMILVPLFDYIGREFNTDIYEGVSEHSFYLVRLLSHLTFTQQALGQDIRYLSNGPLWSISYEFFYYVMFATIVFLRGKIRVVCFLVITVIAGVKVFILFPLWLLGVLIYWMHSKIKMNKWLARTLFFLSPACLYFTFQFYTDINQSFYWLYECFDGVNLAYSKNFVTDYITGFWVFLNILSAKYVEFDIQKIITNKTQATIRFLADSSFAIYLFHFPLLLMFASVLELKTDSLNDAITLFTVTFTVCLLLSFLTERKKKAYKTATTQIWVFLEKRIRAITS